MESGLDGRNNRVEVAGGVTGWAGVSMESGLDGRNNAKKIAPPTFGVPTVSMESGLDGRNNAAAEFATDFRTDCLNGVRPRWPEQWSVPAMRLDMANSSQWSPA